MLELKLKTTSGTFPSSRSAVEQKQPRKQLLALALLLVTFGALIAKDHDFWFGSDDSDSDVINSGVAQATPAQPLPSTAKNATTASAAPVSSLKKQTKIQTASAQAAATPTDDSGAVATERTALPPLDVEVVAGDRHSKLHPGSNTTNLEIANGQTDRPAVAAPATNAAEREAISTTVQATDGSSAGSYPMLAKQMKVEGSVVLQAIIGADGNIQDLRVITGPAILTSAAQQAVRQWRFKPYMQNGQPVETKARITVNFTIHVGDNSPKIS
jgi:TonB family protein